MTNSKMALKVLNHMASESAKYCMVKNDTPVLIDFQHGEDTYSSVYPIEEFVNRKITRSGNIEKLVNEKYKSVTIENKDPEDYIYLDIETRFTFDYKPIMNMWFKILVTSLTVSRYSDIDSSGRFRVLLKLSGSLHFMNVDDELGSEENINIYINCDYLIGVGLKTRQAQDLSNEQIFGDLSECLYSLLYKISETNEEEKQ